MSIWLPRSLARKASPSAPVARSKRENTIKRTGQEGLPWIEFDDGSVYREESKDMAEAIKAGKLEEKRGRAGDAVTPGAA